MTGSVRQAIVLAARLILGGVFIYASLDKIARPEGFAEVIYYYRILPIEAINVAALILPMVELLAGILVISGRWLFPASTVLTGLLLVFMAAIGYSLARGLDFSCGCFSATADDELAGWQTMGRDALLLIPAAICLAASFRKQNGASESETPPGAKTV